MRLNTRGMLSAATALLLLAAPVFAQHGTVIRNAVIWTVDHPTRTITVTAKLRFYPAPRCRSDSYCPPPTAEMINRITAAIERYWNGHSFKCYKLIVKVDVGVVANQAAVPPDAVDIAINVSAVSVSSRMTGRKSSNYLSDDAGDRLEVARSPTDPSTWWASAPDGIYAHEFGHILGLHDNYHEDDHNQPLPGANYDDLMFLSRWGGVSAEMITRVIRRSGKVDESQIRCPMTMDVFPLSVNALFLTIENFQIHAYTCDYSPPSGDSRRWSPIRFEGTARYDGSHIDPVALLAGRFSWLRGTSSGPVNFTVVPARQTPMTVQVNPEVSVYAPLGWTERHLFVAQGELLINEAPASILFGSPVYPVFKQGASECPR